MSNAQYKVPAAVNEAVLTYAPGSRERENIKKVLKELKSKQTEVPLYIGNQKLKEGKKVAMCPPHEHKHVLGYFYEGDKNHVKMAIDSALAAKEKWSSFSWEQRAGIFLKAADLLAGPYRAKINAATMLGQSKNVFQAEIDAACELIDFLRFNVQFMTEIYAQQPISSAGIWNRMEYRPLEGFVFAVTPFNFTAIAANLCCAPAMMGNTVVWKPSDKQMYSAQVIMEVLIEAGLPDGVINMVACDPVSASEMVLSHSDFAGIHFTGSTFVFKEMWKKIGENIHQYKTYPRIVGETGGKDFIIAHSSANVDAFVTAISRGAFEFQGQKCSAASRVYVPSDLWEESREKLLSDIASFKIGSTEDFSNFINAVIDERSFDKLVSFIEKAKTDKDAQIIAGGKYDKSIGYFIQPTVILTSNPHYTTMQEELFGPVVTVYVYPENNFEETLDIVNSTSPYALTGAIFSQDRYALDLAMKKLENAAGNLYINDKPTGAVVGQQPFGGARASGTNDKAGSVLNMLRWVSPRTIKETFTPPTDYRYPFLKEEESKKAVEQVAKV
jgi:1-pyrroline-5-carboxylate dehydrogenase